MNFNNKYYINKFKIRNLWRDFVVLTKMIPMKKRDAKVPYRFNFGQAT